MQSPPQCPRRRPGRTGTAERSRAPPPQTLAVAPHPPPHSAPPLAGTSRNQPRARASAWPRRLPARRRRSAAAAARRRRRASVAPGWLSRSSADLSRGGLLARKIGVAQALLGARQALLRGVG